MSLSLTPISPVALTLTTNTTADSTKKLCSVLFACTEGATCGEIALSLNPANAPASLSLTPA